MAVYVIAVCPECQHYTIPLVAKVEADPPNCVKCALQGRPKGNYGSVTVAELHKAPKMRMVEVIPKEPAFKKKKKVVSA